ncbi:PilW family protein [bacterium]|nr:PilW family protein [bacterium]
MKLSSNKKDQAGFTLIEMLVVVAITSIIFATVFWTLNFQRMSSMKQTALADVYENQRFALDLLSKNIRMAGLNMSAPFYSASYLGIALDPITPDNDWSDGTDRITILSLIDANDCPPLVVDEMTADPSAEMVILDETESEYGGIHDCWANMPTPFFAIITDPSANNSDLFVVTNVQQSALHIQGNQGAGCINGYCNSSNMGNANDYERNSTISLVAFERYSYFLDDLGTPHPKLYMQERYNPPAVPDPAQLPLANDVEDLQFAYGVDTDGDGLIDDLNGDENHGDNEDYVNAPVDVNVPGATNRDIISVRISMTFRSSDWITKQPNSHRPPLEDNPGNFGEAPDGYSRKTISTRVLVRNMAL